MAHSLQQIEVRAEAQFFLNDFQISLSIEQSLIQRSLNLIEPSFPLPPSIFRTEERRRGSFALLNFSIFPLVGHGESSYLSARRFKEVSLILFLIPGDLLLICRQKQQHFILYLKHLILSKKSFAPLASLLLCFYHYFFFPPVNLFRLFVSGAGGVGR